MLRRSLLGLLVVVGCAGAPPRERDPATVDAAAPPARGDNGDPSLASGLRAKLADPSSRAETIKELRRLYEDTIVAARGARDAPEVRAVLDRIVGPLTEAYVGHYAEIAPDLRVYLMKLLEELEDPRTAPAIRKALAEFAAHPTGDRRSDLKWAVRAAGKLRLASLGDALWQAFTKLQVSTPLGGATYRDLNEAMVSMPQPAWTALLIATLKPRIARPMRADDRAAIDAYRDQLFWQTTAAQVLGELRASGAVEALTRVMLEPTKADVHMTAVLALVKIGKPAVAHATQLLEDERSQATAAIILGTIGRPEAVQPLVAASKTAAPMSRAVIARELTKLPASAASKAAFKSAFESIQPGTSVPPGIDAHVMLAEAAGEFRDPVLIDWLIERAKKAKGGGDPNELRTAILHTILRLAKPDQIPNAKAAVDKWGTPFERELLRQASDVTKRCGDSARCYVAEMAKEANQSQKQQFVAIKAGYMAAIFGNAATREDIVARLDSMENAAVRFVAAQAIDHLSPKGSTQMAANIQSLIARNAARADPSVHAADAPLKQVMYRIRTRAE